MLHCSKSTCCALFKTVVLTKMLKESGWAVAKIICLIAVVILVFAASCRVPVQDRIPSELAEFFAGIAAPAENPAGWKWSPATAEKVLRILGPKEELYRHYADRVEPNSLRFPFESSEGEAPAVGRGQGGMTYVNWTFGLSKLVDISIDVTFHESPKGPAAVYLQLYDFPIGKTGQYFGFQYSFPEKDRLETRFIWSRWETRDKSNAWVAEGGWVESAGYEGDFVGIRYPYLWQQGTYTVHLRMAETDGFGTWYEMRIYDHKKHKWTIIGRLRFPLVDGELPFISDGGASWCEVFAGAETSKDIQTFHLSYGGAYTCGRTVAAKRIRIGYGQQLSNSDVSIDPDGRRVHVRYGGRIKRRTKAGIYTLEKEMKEADGIDY